MSESKATPRVSVIIPNYNHARFLRKRIESVLGQTFRDLEVILMDDCSTDESRSIISEYAKDPQVRIEYNEKNSGSTFKQWNKGVSLARGEFVWIAESDDYADERLLEKLVPIFDEEKAVTFAYCRSWKITDDGQGDEFADDYLEVLDAHRWESDYRADGREECRTYLTWSNTIPNASAVLFRKDIYQRVGGADESLRLCGDWKLWASMALEGKIAYVGEPLNYFRVHGETVRNKSQQVGLNVIEALEVTHWILERVTPTKAALQRIQRGICLHWIPALLTSRVPLARRRAIFRGAMAIDPYALLRLVRPGLVAIRLKVALEWRLLRERIEGRAS